jgi:hypothetical protein
MREEFGTSGTNIESDFLIFGSDITTRGWLSDVKRDIMESITILAS